jgi:hypothetical protein
MPVAPAFKLSGKHSANWERRFPLNFPLNGACLRRKRRAAPPALSLFEGRSNSFKALHDGVFFPLLRVARERRWKGEGLYSVGSELYCPEPAESPFFGYTPGQASSAI